LKLAKAAYVLSPIQSVLSGRGIGMKRPGSPLRCKSSEVGTRMDMSEPVVAGTDMSTRENGDASVEMPTDSLPAASDDDEETGLVGGYARGFVERSIEMSTNLTSTTTVMMLTSQIQCCAVHQGGGSGREEATRRQTR
jgi:hypothetical protein